MTDPLRNAEYWCWRYRNAETGQICRTRFLMSEEEAKAMYCDAERVAGTMTRREVEADSTASVGSPEKAP